MTLRRLIARSLRFHFRSHLGVVLGAAVGSAALTGALVVGDSVRASLRESALERLGNTYFAIAPPDRFFSRGFASRIRRYPFGVFSAVGNTLASAGEDGTIRLWDPATGQEKMAMKLVPPGRAGQLFLSSTPQQANDAALLSLPGTIYQPTSGARANHIQVFGVDANFWSFNGGSNSPPFREGGVRLNAALAAQLGVKPGDELVLRVQRPGLMSTDAAITQRANQSLGLRLTFKGVVSSDLGGELALRSGAGPTWNGFVDIDELAKAANLEGKANLLVAGPIVYPASFHSQGLSGLLFRARRLLEYALWHGSYVPPAHIATTQESLNFLAGELQRNWTLADADAKLEYAPDPFAVELRTHRVFLDPPLAQAALTLGSTNAVPILTYLANLISTGTSSTPYSMVTAAGPPYTPADLRDDEIVLNHWLADDLHAKPGDMLELSYFLPESGAQLAEATSHFRVRSIVPLEGIYADRTLMPDFPGIEKAERTSDWDAGFELVYTIRTKDEDYWKQHRGTPKAFVTLAAGQKMWANRFGNLTAVRVLKPAAVPDEMSTGEFWFHFKTKLLASVKPETLGLRFEPVRDQALKAADQAQDFGQLFLGFSIFLVAAALLLMAMLFQFGVEQRQVEVGTFLALGFRPKQVRRMLLAEGTVLALIGGLLGACGGVAYAKAMLWGLNTVWRNAVGPSVLRFDVTALTLVLGFLSSTLVAVITIALTLRKQARQPPYALLAGEGAAQPERSADMLSALDNRRPKADRMSALRSLWYRWRLRAIGVAVVSGLGAVAIVVWALVTKETANAEAFFSAGSLLLIAGLALIFAWLGAIAGARTVLSAATSENRLTQNLSDRSACVSFRPHLTLGGLGVRNCARRRTRSLATVALLACGSFVIASIGVFRLDANRDATARTSGTGGFELVGESTTPVSQDLNTKTGQEFFGLNAKDLSGVTFVPFRVREGDEASCLNLNRAQQPRLLGVNPALLDGRFTFASVAKGCDPQNGWNLLSSTANDGTPPSAADEDIPAIGDANSIEWALGKKLGDTLDYTDERGRAFKLRLVGAVANSILQGSLLVDERAFLKKFPGESGYRMFLIDAPTNSVTEVSATLSRALQDVGLELTPTVRKLDALNAVQNTYLGTFQVLGGLGLLLGSAGLGVVVLRNVLERRGELGLMVAVGFRRRRLQRLLLSEHAALLGFGLGVGLVAAAIAVLPSLLSPGTQLPYVSLAWTLGAVLFNGALWTWMATRYALRGNLLEALRNE
jgi:ABC-type antimicrobial peptide transport system permease subunit